MCIYLLNRMTVQHIFPSQDGINNMSPQIKSYEIFIRFSFQIMEKSQGVGDVLSIKKIRGGIT